MKRNWKASVLALGMTVVMAASVISLPQMTASADLHTVIQLKTPDSAQVTQLAQNQGVVIPQNFSWQAPVSGTMYNDSGSEYYAVYKYKNPNQAGNTDLRYGTFCFRNTTRSDTNQYDGSVVFYGFYNGWGLFLHDSELFWANPMYFHGAVQQTASQVSARLSQMAREQNVVIPSGFVPSSPDYGSMYNDSGSVYYAVYQYKDPAVAGDSNKRYGTFCFPNTRDGDTSSYDGIVTLYGYYNGLGLFEHYGELFWANPDYFHSAVVNNLTQIAQQVVQKAKAQNVVLPTGFAVLSPISGVMRNDTGTTYYAIYQYKDPSQGYDTKNSFGTFLFPAAVNPDTAKFDGSVTVYGYFKGYGLYEHNGTLFWATTTYFHSNQVIPMRNTNEITQVANAQGVVLPYGFVPSKPCYGSMYNNTGSVYYAVYRFSDPANTDQSYSLGTFWFPCSQNPQTTNSDSTVALYGYYNGYGLFDHYGELFWASPEFFHPAQ